MASRSATRKPIRTAAWLSLIPGLIGLALLHWPPTASFESLGLDLMFLVRGTRPVPEAVCVVALDEDSYWVQGVDPSDPWPRGLHGDLVKILAREGVRAVAFDVLFEGASNPDQDAAFLEGIREAGHVVLAATVDQVEDARFRQVRRIEPHAPFMEAAAAVGEVSLTEDRDGVIRGVTLVDREGGGRPKLALAAHDVAFPGRPYRGPVDRLIDYYGPARTIPTVSIYQALAPSEYLPPGFFRDRIVFVGASLVAAAGPTEAKDSFRTPFRGGSRGNTFGVEIHATILANLLEGRDLRVVPPGAVAVSFLLIPLIATIAFVMLRPALGVAALVIFELIPGSIGYLAFTRGGWWYPVVIPTLVQLPLAWVVSLTWYYMTTVRERERIRRAFAFYLAPDMIARVTAKPEELNLGGEEVVGTAMFTDIAGFTTISERMAPPETAAMLNDYFSESTAHVFRTGGTLIKYIGDAIFAIWGAPVPVPDHAGQACRAAIGMSRPPASREDRPAGRLVTRIGVHTGPMLVGNLGSTQRFDYTAIGDTVNLAARLEGINKQFGTRVLVSEETLRATEGGLAVRRVGRVGVAGREEPVTCYELIGVKGEPGRPDEATVARFERALEDWVAGRFREAEEGFREVVRMCGGEDGPSALYLDRLAGLEGQPPPEGWDGVLRFRTK